MIYEVPNEKFNFPKPTQNRCLVLSYKAWDRNVEGALQFLFIWVLMYAQQQQRWQLMPSHPDIHPESFQSERGERLFGCVGVCLAPRNRAWEHSFWPLTDTCCTALTQLTRMFAGPLRRHNPTTASVVGLGHLTDDAARRPPQAQCVLPENKKYIQNFVLWGLSVFFWDLIIASCGDLGLWASLETPEGQTVTGNYARLQCAWLFLLLLVAGHISYKVLGGKKTLLKDLFWLGRAAISM